MKIDHWHPQEGYKDEDLVYANLLGVCMGNEGQEHKAQHCDTRKGNAILAYNPANPDHHIEERLSYTGNGTLKSTDTDFDDQINKVLNLNWIRLKENRKAIIDAVEKALSARPGTRTKAELENFLRRWQEPATDGCLNPYSGTAIYFLKKRLKRA
jgi:hypothetical protein